MSAAKYQQLIEQPHDITGNTRGITGNTPLGITGITPQTRLSTSLDTLPIRAREIQAIETLAGLRVEEVSAIALRLEAPVRWTQSSVSAIALRLEAPVRWTQSSVSAIALRVEAPIRWAQSSVSAILEGPLNYTILLRQTALRLWRGFVHLMWQIVFALGVGIIFNSLICGNWRRVTPLVLAIGLLRVISDLSVLFVLPVCLLVVYFA